MFIEVKLIPVIRTLNAVSYKYGIQSSLCFVFLIYTKQYSLFMQMFHENHESDKQTEKQIFCESNGEEKRNRNVYD